MRLIKHAHFTPKNTQLNKCTSSINQRQYHNRNQTQTTTQIQHCKLECKVPKYNTAQDCSVNSTIVESRTQGTMRKTQQELLRAYALVHKCFICVLIKVFQYSVVCKPQVNCTWSYAPAKNTARTPWSICTRAQIFKLDHSSIQ